MRRLRSKAKPALPLARSGRLPDGYPPTRPSVSAFPCCQPTPWASGRAPDQVSVAFPTKGDKPHGIGIVKEEERKQTIAEGAPMSMLELRHYTQSHRRLK